MKNNIIDSSLAFKNGLELGRKEMRDEIIKMGDKLDKSYVIDKKKMFWRELKEQLKEKEQ